MTALPKRPAGTQKPIDERGIVRQDVIIKMPIGTCRNDYITE